MPALKGIIFSLRDVIVNKDVESEVFDETIKLLKFLLLNGIEPVFIGNHDWSVSQNGEPSVPFKKFLETSLGAPVQYYIGGQGGMPFKPKKEATKFVLDQHGWSRNEVVFVGNTETDMRTASNGKLLFLNAEWHTQDSPYGFKFTSPRDIARFIDCCCIEHAGWFWSTSTNKTSVFAIAPYATYSPNHPKAKPYSEHAVDTSKNLLGDATFWGRLLAARIYLSGLVDKFEYIAPYPGHSTESNETPIAEALAILAGSLKQKYLPDLIIRHTTSMKSSTARNKGISPGHENQLNTICLNPTPLMNQTDKRYKSSPLKKGKTVLIVDDICTQGNSFEAARVYVEATGAKTIGLAWLKTPANDYNRITKVTPAISNPYEPNTVDNVKSASVWYSTNIKNKMADEQLADVFDRYFNWDWPAND